MRLFRTEDFEKWIALSFMIESWPYYWKSKRIWFDKTAKDLSDMNDSISLSDLQFTPSSLEHFKMSTRMYYVRSESMLPWISKSVSSTHNNISLKFSNTLLWRSFMGQNLWSLLSDNPSSPDEQEWVSKSVSLISI